MNNGKTKSYPTSPVFKRLKSMKQETEDDELSLKKIFQISNSNIKINGYNLSQLKIPILRREHYVKK